MSAPLSSFPSNSAFIIHDSEIPAKFSQHKGRLWECEHCAKSYTRKDRFHKEPCKDSRMDVRHRFLFHADADETVKIPDSWGNSRACRKGTRPWGCPHGDIYLGEHLSVVQRDSFPCKKKVTHPQLSTPKILIMVFEPKMTKYAYFIYHFHPFLRFAKVQNGCQMYKMT